MSQVILRWLNEEVKIPRKVRNVQSDFANGVLFAEVFRKLKPEIDISAYSDKNIVANYKLLQPLLQEYKVDYDNELLRNVILEKKGAALRLLFQLRQVLQKAQPRKGKSGTLAQKTAELNATIGTGAVGRLDHYGTGLVAAQAGVTMRNIVAKKGQDRALAERLAGFQEQQIRQLTDALDAQRREERAHSAYLGAERAAHLATLARNQELMGEWERKNIENWKKSMRDKRAMLARLQHFRELEVEKHKTSIRRLMGEAASDMRDGIDAFEKNLARQGIDINARRDDRQPGPPPPIDFATLDRVTIRRLQPQAMLGHFSAVATLNKIREKKKTHEHARKERDKLRTKLQLEQDRAKAALEAAKTEDAQVVKFLKGLRGQKQDNFLAWRAQHNDAVDTRNRAEKAARQEQELSQAINAFSEAQTEAFKDEAKARQARYKQQKLEYRKINQQRKAEKRGKHATGCKEIVKSILDIALAVFDTRQEQVEAVRREGGFVQDAPPVPTAEWTEQEAKLSQAEQVDVKQWREWIAQFVEGKGVFDDEDDDMATPLPPPPPQPEESQQDIVGLGDDGLAGANAVDEVEFVDYAQGLGLWEGLSDGKHNWRDFLEMQRDFGDMLQGVVSTQFSKQAKQREALRAERLQELPPQDLTLKICINGPIFTGKSLQAAAIKQSYPGLVLLEAAQVLKESLLLVDPAKKEEEAPDPKKKKEAPKKGAPAEDLYTQLVTEYEGTEFQRLSARLREDLLAARGGGIGGEGEGEGVESPLLLSEAWGLISPESMSKLLVCRIRHQCEKDAKGVDEQELRAQIKREAEIEEELERLAEEAAAAANDPKAKKAPLKPGQKSPEELLKEELDDLRTPPLSGWVVVGFPNSQEEATAFFEALSGFRQQALEGEQPEELFAHTAARLAPCSRAGIGERKPLIEPGVDAMISLGGSTVESMRRFEGRKMDPATGAIYHMEDNPPPPNVAPEKLVEVVAEEGEIPHTPDAMARSFERWEHGARGFEKWMRQFGIQGRFRTHFMDNGQGPSAKQDAVKGRVLNVVERLLDVKRQLLKERKDELKLKIATEPAQAEEEAAPAPAPAPAPAASTTPVPDTTPPPEEPSKDQSEAVAATPAADASRISAMEEENANSVENHLFAVWNELSELYISTIKGQLSKLVQQQVAITGGLTTLQQRFAGYLARPDNKQVLLEECVDQFQNIADTHPGWAEDATVQRALAAQLEKTGDDLWDVIERRKQEAEAERARVMEQGWVKKQLVKMFRVFHRLANIEFLKFKTSLALLHQYHSRNPDEVDVEESELVSKLEGVPLLNADEEPQVMDGTLRAFQLPKAEAIHFAFSRRVDGEFSKFAPGAGEGLAAGEKLRVAAKFRGEVLRAWFVREAHEVLHMAAAIYQRMDDWIVLAVFGENKLIGAAIKGLQRQIAQGQRDVEVAPVGPLSLDSFEIAPVDAAGLSSRRSSGMLPKVGSSVGAFLLGVFQPAELRVLLERLERAADDHLYIKRRRAFQFFLELAKEEGSVLPEAWRGMSAMMFRVLLRALDSGNRGYLEWRHLGSYLCLLKSSLPLAMELNYYRDALRQHSSSQDDETYISLQKFVDTAAWFDESERDEAGRLAEIKWLLFEMNRDGEVAGEEARLHIEEWLQVVMGADYGATQQRSYYELLFDMK